MISQFIKPINRTTIKDRKNSIICIFHASPRIRIIKIIQIVPQQNHIKVSSSPLHQEPNLINSTIHTITKPNLNNSEEV